MGADVGVHVAGVRDHDIRLLETGHLVGDIHVHEIGLQGEGTELSGLPGRIRVTLEQDLADIDPAGDGTGVLSCADHMEGHVHPDVPVHRLGNQPEGLGGVGIIEVVLVAGLGEGVGILAVVLERAAGLEIDDLAIGQVQGEGAGCAHLQTTAHAVHPVVGIVGSGNRRRVDFGVVLPLAVLPGGPDPDMGALPDTVEDFDFGNVSLDVVGILIVRSELDAG